MASDFCGKPRCSTPLDFIILHPSSDPASFYRCLHSGTSAVLQLEHCPNSGVFLFEQQACTEGNEWYDPCTTPILPPHAACSVPTCHTPLEARILFPADTPDRLYLCDGDRLYTITCTEGSWFDFKQQDCVAPNNWNNVCEFDISSTTSLPPTTCEMPQCVQADLSLLHPVAEDSRSFYRCEPTAGGFAAIRRECPSGFSFGFQQQECVWPRDWLNPCV
jgi:hypothetical protein